MCIYTYEALYVLKTKAGTKKRQSSSRHCNCTLQLVGTSSVSFLFPLIIKSQMDAPHVLVVDEVVDSLLFESDLMGNLIKRYSYSTDVDGPVVFREKVVDDLDDTVKMDLTPDDYDDEPPKTPGDDYQGIINNVFVYV